MFNEPESIIENEPESFSLDKFVREQLAEAARWAKLLATVGFICCGIISLMGIGMALFSSLAKSSLYYSSRGTLTSNKGAFIWVVYFIFAVLYFYRCLFLYRFAIKMKTGLHEQNLEEVKESLFNLKKLFRYNGILTIVGVSLYLLVFIVGVIAILFRHI